MKIFQIYLNKEHVQIKPFGVSGIIINLKQYNNNNLQKIILGVTK